ncbi:MAG: BLUF domain-containing protein [Rhodothermales bacterium]|nr:BLUF domain-containing protein [Rhodothermales bacterium]MBO6778378.1 BLUF domain-containing protein [Rhodothermales bacterium]
MIQMIYASAATVPFSEADLQALLAKARVNNQRANVTGMLVYDQGSFLQVLEGPEAAVDSIYRRIERDRRHGNVLLLAKTHVTKRSFGEWKMGFFNTGGAHLPGFSDFFRRKMPFAGAELDQARSILLRFKRGKWHRHVA